MAISLMVTKLSLGLAVSDMFSSGHSLA